MADENAPTERATLGRSPIFTPEVINDIHMKAELGRYRMRGFSMFKKLPHWDELRGALPGGEDGARQGRLDGGHGDLLGGGRNDPARARPLDQVVLPGDP